MPGPPPKPASQRRRTNPVPGETRLPSSGRQGPAPEWPLGKASKAEAALWAELWTWPQAVVWERDRSARIVARYVRKVIASERPKAPIALLAEVRQMEDRLALTTIALMRARLVIVDDDEHQGVGPGPAGPSAPVADMARYRAAMAERTT